MSAQNDFGVLETALKNNDIDDVKKLLQNFQVNTTDGCGHTCLMVACGWFSSAEVVKLVFEKITKAGDTALLKTQLTVSDGAGKTCLMHAYHNTSSSSPEVVKLVFGKIDEAGGIDLLKTQLTVSDGAGKTCLMHACCSSSAELVKLVVQKIVEVGDTALLKSQLIATDKKGRSCMMDAATTSSPRAVLSLFAAFLFAAGLFKEQYESFSYNLKRSLKGGAGIDSSSWAPDAAILAKVKAILQGGDAAAAKKKAEEEAAAAKKKAEEEAAAAKKKAEEEAAAKKKAEEEAAAKKKAEEHATTAAATETKKNDEASSPSQQQLQQQKQQDIGAVSSDAAPPALCFKRGIPPKDFEDSTNSLMSIKEAPSNRPDLLDWVPDKQDASSLLHYLKCNLAELKSRPAIQKLIAENGLTDDEIKILHSYKIQMPYPVYLWLNGWLGGNRRDDFVKQNVAPFFTLLYRAMEKLPRIKRPANRAIKVNGIASLKNTFDNYTTTCAPKKTLSFWGFSSFSTESDVINREEFVGKLDEQAIVYSCGELEGVDMEPFAPKGLKNESEILPLCPCVLEVASAVKFGQKLFVSVKQLDHANFSYVAPSM